MRVRSLLKYLLLLGSLVSILVAGMLYTISPGEVEIAVSAVRSRLAGGKLQAAPSRAQASDKIVDRVRKPVAAPHDQTHANTTTP